MSSGLHFHDATNVSSRAPVRGSLLPRLQMVRCPACGRQGSVAFLQTDNKPLATVYWPRSSEEARSMKRLPLSFMRCVHCGHVFNRDFRYGEVPYSSKPNLMFNHGIKWAEHIDHVNDVLTQHLPASPTVVEIGCGDGCFLRSLAEKLTTGRYVGFDPNETFRRDEQVEFRGELFDPARHLAELQPDALVCRHVLEHLENPLEFLDGIAVAVAYLGFDTRLLAEVPCIDRAIESGRVADFYYEHNSHFTTQSFRAMLQRSGAALETLERRYNDEVLCAVVLFPGSKQVTDLAIETNRFRQNADSRKRSICVQLDQLVDQGVRVAIWGGTGKGAAFMNYYDVDAERFPLVVDSDPNKCNSYVPGTGQRIQYRDVLLSIAPEVIIVPMQWRARDIQLEIKQAGIGCQQLLIEHAGRLVELSQAGHPY